MCLRQPRGNGIISARHPPWLSNQQSGLCAWTSHDTSLPVPVLEAEQVAQSSPWSVDLELRPAGLAHEGDERDCPGVRAMSAQRHADPHELTLPSIYASSNRSTLGRFKLVSSKQRMARTLAKICRAVKAPKYPQRSVIDPAHPLTVLVDALDPEQIR